MDNRGNGIDYIIEKSSIPEEFKDIAEAQSKNTCDILKQRTTNNRKTIKIVGPCSKWIDGEGWVTEIPISQIENIFCIGKNVVVIDKQDFQKKVEEEVNHRITAELMRERVELTKEIIDKIDDMIGGKMIAQALREIYEVEE